MASIHNVSCSAEIHSYLEDTSHYVNGTHSIQINISKSIHNVRVLFKEIANVIFSILTALLECIL